MNARTEEITERFTEWLDRYSPPRHMTSQPKTMQIEADALLGVLLRKGPTQGYAAWVGEVLDRLSAAMKTRAWPTVNEMTEACRAKANGPRGGDEDDRVEENCVRMLASWFGKFQSEMPSMGRADRTRKLIDTGVIENERAAKFYGFNLSEVDARKAADQRMTRPEWEHHIRVTAKLRGISYAEADQAERARAAQDMPIGDHVKRMPYAEGDMA